ncbi:MAG: HAMP domain-containing protein [Proteobacteria bacterium]|nr:HAMP domain-containing protein [Pseudomonadota bacterium]
MTTSEDTTTSSSPLLVLALALVLTLCVALIGTAGYFKYQLDKDQNILAAPDTAFAPEEQIYEKTIGALGYSGFLGAAQNYMTSHDPAALADMRMNLKTAQENVVRLANAASGPVSRDIKAIVDIFAAISAKAESSDALDDGINTSDLLRASTALTILDSRLQTATAITRLQTNNDLKGWGMGLMLLTWGAGALLALLSLLSFFAFRSRQIAPLNALIQCIDNIGKGNLHQPVWGQERPDRIGELARALEKARLHFAELPDFVLQGEEGPIPFRFEGMQRTAFDAMMKKIAESFDQTKSNAATLNAMCTSQQEMMSGLSVRLGSALDNIHQQGQIHEEALHSLTQALNESAHSLAATQKNGMDQINQMIPSMRERIQNMAEVTQLAGIQVADSLKSLLAAEDSMRTNASQSHQVVKQLANATNQMGERMFAALNIMQASGKALNRSTEETRVRFNEALEILSRGEKHLQHIITRAENRLASTMNAEENMAALATRTEESALKMEKAVNNICERHEGLSEQVITATHRMESIVASFDSAQRSMAEATSQIRRDGNTISNLLTDLRVNNEQLISSINQNSQNSFTAVQNLTEKSHALMQRLEVQIQQQAQATETRIDEIIASSEALAQQSSSTNNSLAQAVASLKGEQEKLSTARSRFVEMLGDIGSRLEQQATNTFGKTEQWAAQSFTKLTTIAEQVESVMQRLGMLGQLTSTLGTVAGQLGQLVPTLTQFEMPKPLATPYADTPPIIVDMEETRALMTEQAEDLATKLQEHWHEAVVQIEAMHDQLAQMMVQQKDQLETRLIVIDKKLRETTEEMRNLQEIEQTDERQTEIMNEVISAISRINQHVIELDDTVEQAGLKKEVS